LSIQHVSLLTSVARSSTLGDLDSTGAPTMHPGQRGARSLRPALPSPRQAQALASLCDAKALITGA
jgi:hypothetical protein